MGLSKNIGTNITENHLDNLFASFFGQALDQMGQNANIWPKELILAKIGRYGPKILISMGDQAKV